jgi:hypothetical protein
MTAAPSCRFFLGGHDLEMVTIAELLREAGLGGRVEDKHLSWGAKASAYAKEIRESLRNGETPVLIELADDLGEDAGRSRILFVDHHGERAGAGAPSALRQIFDLAGPGRGLSWTRHCALVEANDIGHAEGLRAAGASPAEIRAIRDADRRAQGIGAGVEEESRRAIATMTWQGGLAIVNTKAHTSSAIIDFLLPEYGGPGARNLLVLMPDKAAFSGEGKVVLALSCVPGSWCGGALPERGYWGAPRASTGSAARLAATITTLLGGAA